MKHKVSELEGALLDAAVAKAEGREVRQETYGISEGQWLERWPTHWYWIRVPSRTWADGGPIIERERIVLFIGEIDRRGEMPWTAWAGGVAVTALSGLCDFVGPDDCVAQGSTGPTPLIAAMRAYVSSKLGEEIELP